MLKQHNYKVSDVPHPLQFTDSLPVHVECRLGGSTCNERCEWCSRSTATSLAPARRSAMALRPAIVSTYVQGAASKSYVHTVHAVPGVTSVCCRSSLAKLCAIANAYLAANPE